MRYTQPLPKKSRRSGFSVLEMLVALGILSVLLSIVLPVVQGYTERARRAEAVAMIGEMQARLETWRAENPTYDVESGTAGFGDFPQGDHYDITLGEASATGYTLTATGKGKQANDDECSEVAVTKAGSSETRLPDPDQSECW